MLAEIIDPDHKMPWWNYSVTVEVCPACGGEDTSFIGYGDYIRYCNKCCEPYSDDWEEVTKTVEAYCGPDFNNINTLLSKAFYLLNLKW